METIRKLLFEELAKEQKYDNFGTLDVGAINFIGYKNKKNIGKLVLALNTLDIDLYELKKRVEEVLDNNNIKCKSIYLEL